MWSGRLSALRGAKTPEAPNFGLTGALLHHSPETEDEHRTTAAIYDSLLKA